MGNLIDKDGVSWDIPADEMQAALDSGLYEVPSGTTTTIVEEDETATVGVEHMAGAVERGARAENIGETLDRQETARLEDEHSGFAQGALTVAESVAGTALPGFDIVAGSIGGEEYRKSRAGRHKTRSYLSAGGDVAGMLLPGGVLKAGGKVSSLAKLGSKGIKGQAAEGAIRGAMEGVHRLALDNDPLTMENVATAAIHGGLYGGALGGGVGVFSKAASKGIGKAKSLADDAAAKLSKKSGIADDLAGMSRAELKAAQRVEAEAMEQAATSAKSALVDDIGALHVASKAAGQEIKLGSALGNMKGLARNPQKILDTLERSEQALSRISAQGAKARAVGDVAEQARFAQVDDLLQQNRSMQSRIHEAYKPAPTPRMQQIDDALEVSMGGGAAKPSMVEKAVEGSIFGAVTGAVAPVTGSLAPLIGGKAASKITDLIFGRLARSGGEAAARTAKSVSGLMDIAGKVGKAAKPLATKTLVAASFGPLSRDDPAPRKHTLQTAYKARAGEIRDQVTMGPDGITMRPQSRRQLAQRLSGVRAVSPRLADHIETVANRKISFLANKLPKRPDFLRHTTGPDTWLPSNQEMRKFARYVAALDDPGAVEERLADGSLSPEDAEAYRAVFPEKYADLQRVIAEQLPELRAALPYAKRISLSIFSGVAIDPSLDPRIFSRLQSQYADEPGTEQGTSAPKPAPQFGSIRSQEKAMTPSQERQS